MKRIEYLAVMLKFSDILSIREFSEDHFKHFLQKKACAEWEHKLLDLISVDFKHIGPFKR